MRAKFQKEVIDQSLSDIQVELDSEFDKNFVRKSFFNEEKWPDRKNDDGKGSLMQRTGGLRRSISSRKRRSELVYSSHKPYARIHNEGGEIKVTKKMRGYFMYCLAEIQEQLGHSSRKKKTGESRNDSKNRSLTKEEQLCTAIIGASKITIPKRQFIGQGKATDKIIRDIVRENMDDFFKNNEIITE